MATFPHFYPLLNLPFSSGYKRRNPMFLPYEDFLKQNFQCFLYPFQVLLELDFFPPVLDTQDNEEFRRTTC